MKRNKLLSLALVALAISVGASSVFAASNPTVGGVDQATTTKTFTNPAPVAAGTNTGAREAVASPTVNVKPAAATISAQKATTASAKDQIAAKAVSLDSATATATAAVNAGLVLAVAHTVDASANPAAMVPLLN
ncbi:MAG: hypothetical protein WC835_00205 [Candidatus Paceibacterota bacterium]|jgi:hypothetical protein